MLNGKCSLTVSIVCMCIVLFVAGTAGCRRHPAPEREPRAVSVSDPVFRDTTLSVLSDEIREIASGSESFREMQESGFLKVALECSRPPLCALNKYGAARGFEVDLLRQVASFFGVKLNVVGHGEEAHLYGPVKPGSWKQVSEPYFYSEKTGWLGFRIEGDRGFADTVNLVINHLYETGTYQQLYKNWFETAGNASEEVSGGGEKQPGEAAIETQAN